MAGAMRGMARTLNEYARSYHAVNYCDVKRVRVEPVLDARADLEEQALQSRGKDSTNQLREESLMKKHQLLTSGGAGKPGK